MPLHDKCTGEHRDTRDIPTHNKKVHSMTTAHINIKREKLQAIPLKVRTRQCCLKSPHLFNRILEVLAKVIIQLKETKGIQIEKEEVKIHLLSDDRSVCVPKIFAG